MRVGDLPIFRSASFTNAPYGFPDSVVMPLSSLIELFETSPDFALRLIPTGEEYDTGSSPHAASATHANTKATSFIMFLQTHVRVFRFSANQGLHGCRQRTDLHTAGHAMGGARAHTRFDRASLDAEREEARRRAHDASCIGGSEAANDDAPDRAAAAARVVVSGGAVERRARGRGARAARAARRRLGHRRRTALRDGGAALAVLARSPRLRAIAGAATAAAVRREHGRGGDRDRRRLEQQRTAAAAAAPAAGVGAGARSGLAAGAAEIDRAADRDLLERGDLQRAAAPAAAGRGRGRARSAAAAAAAPDERLEGHREARRPTAAAGRGPGGAAHAPGISATAAA